MTTNAAPAFHRHPVRPSSARRVDNLRALLTEFTLRAMACSDVAALLQCSHSAARIYILELLDAGIIGRHTVCTAAAGMARVIYCHYPDSAAGNSFLAALAQPEAYGRRIAKRRSQRAETLACAHYVHSLWDDDIVLIDGEHAPVRRDPLVAALFGAAGEAPNTHPAL